MTGGGAQIIPHWATSKPMTGAISPSKAHLYKPKGAQEHKGRQEPKLRTQRKGHHVQALPRAVPGYPPPRCPGLRPIKNISSSPDHLWDWGHSLTRVMGDIMGCRGRAFWDCTRFVMRSLGKEQKEGKGKDTDDFRRIKCGKTEG